MSVGMQRLRDEPELIRQGAIDKGEDPAVVDAALALDERRRALLSEGDGLKAERNTASKQVGEAIRGGASPDGPEVAALRAASTAAGERIAAIDAELADGRGRARRRDAAHPQSGRPGRAGRRRGGHRHGPDVGRAAAPRRSRSSARSAPTRRPAARPGSGGRTGRSRADLRLFDLERGAKIAGSGFPVYTGLGSRLQRSLINWFLDVHVTENGFTEVWPPVVVNAASARGTGQIPDKEDQMYVVTRDELYLVPTSEVPVTNLHRDEILEATDLPIHYAAYSPCFRREAGAAGKDTRGILRVHQFDKVEMVLFEKPADSDAALEWMTGRAEILLQRLGPGLPGPAHEHARAGLRPGQEVRPRGLGARRRALARGQLVLEHARLPGPPDGDPLPARGRRQAGARPHAQRVGPGARPGRRGPARDVPAGRRVGDRPGGPPRGDGD